MDIGLGIFVGLHGLDLLKPNLWETLNRGYLI